MKNFCALLLCFLVPWAGAFAQSDSAGFNIKVFGAEDIVAPTAPSALSANPVSTDQIDLTWGISTDNFVVSGYVVYRNGVAIGTTTQNSYSDLGLAASTAYSYYVQAFDPSFNYSSSSNTAVATTLAPPPADTDEGNDTSTATRVNLDELIVTPGVSTSSFFIKTVRPARFEVRWGRTSSFELGYIVNDRFVSTFETTITDLEPGTRYEYEVVGYSAIGNDYVLKRGSFTTLSSADFLPPANVSRFQVFADSTDAALSWQLPIGEQFESVRIVRSHLRFPLYPSDGAVIYQGLGTDFTDKDILRQYSPVYYTAFVIDAAGNVSSGAIAKVYAGQGIGAPGAGIIIPRPGEGNGPIKTGEPDEGGVVMPPADGFVPGVPLGGNTYLPELSDIFLTQDPFERTFADQGITLNSQEAFILSIPKEALSDNFKTIIVTFTDPTDSRLTSSFLLRINKDNTAYETVVAPLGLEGSSRIIVDVYDYDAALTGTYQKTVMFKNLNIAETVPFFPDRLLLWFTAIAPYPGIVLLLLLLMFFYRRLRVGNAD